jgi:ferrochelatase
MKQTGVLLVNLGTPASCTTWNVFRYLNEFLTDGRVIDLPWALRQWLVRATIVPRRLRASTKLYQRIWTAAGSPLLIHSLAIQSRLQAALGDEFMVSLGMRYQQPSLAMALDALQAPHIQSLIIVPLFPQYASATTGSIHQKVMETVSRWNIIPELRFINSYPTQPQLIQAFAMRGRALGLANYDHCVFSFHGLPKSQIQKADPCRRCLVESECCATRATSNQHCYRAQCYDTARALASELALTADQYSICFQSRLGKDPWTQPYTEDTLRDLAKRGSRRLLVFAPAFTCDCLETLDEIGREYAHQFQQAGGASLQLVPSVNDHPLWIEGLKALVLERNAGFC